MFGKFGWANALLSNKKIRWRQFLKFPAFAPLIRSLRDLKLTFLVGQTSHHHAPMSWLKPLSKECTFQNACDRQSQSVFFKGPRYVIDAPQFAIAHGKLLARQPCGSDYRGLISKLLSYSTGRKMGPVDEDILQKIKEDGYGFGALVVEVMTSEIMRSR